MNNLIRISALSALICAGAFGCQAGKEASKDTTISQVQPPLDTVSTPADTGAAPAAAAESQAKTAPQTPAKEAVPPKTKTAQTAQAAPAAAAALKQAQEKAEAARIAKADSVKRAEAAKVAAKPAPAAPRVEPAAPAGAVDLAEGKTLYEADCRKCHGVRGIPPKTMQAKFPKIDTFDAAFFARRSADSVVTVLTRGKGEDMKSFKDKLSHAQMVAIAAYIRTFAQ